MISELIMTKVGKGKNQGHSERRSMVGGEKGMNVVDSCWSGLGDTALLRSIHKVRYERTCLLEVLVGERAQKQCELPLRVSSLETTIQERLSPTPRTSALEKNFVFPIPFLREKSRRRWC